MAVNWAGRVVLRPNLNKADSEICASAMQWLVLSSLKQGYYKTRIHCWLTFQHKDSASMAPQPGFLGSFLKPLRIDIDTVDSLSCAFLENFEALALDSENQFLPTPISESILRPTTNNGAGW